MTVEPRGMTIRLYHIDAYQREFASTVTMTRRDSGGPAIALAQTAFYPSAGGQPPDTGRLGPFAVLDVRDDNGEVWHVLAPSPEAALPAVGARLTGTIDWDRRYDHMQHHTGQHILSQAFLQALGAATVSVHMDQSCTIDLSIPALTGAQIDRVERLANDVVMQNRPVIIREMDPDEAARAGLRRPAKAYDRIRVVEVEGFDRSACGGTHVRASAEIGTIVIRAWDRYKGGVRVDFLCGSRTLGDYHRARGLLRDLTGMLTCGEDELGSAVSRLRDRAKDLERELTEARSRRLEQEAAELLAAAARDAGVGESGGAAVVSAVFDARPPDELRALARAISGRSPSVVVLAVEADRRLLIARGQGVVVDAAAVLREALAPFGGRGGGRPETAEGVAPDAPSASALADAAARAARRLAADA